jgi:hypothetical protein
VIDRDKREKESEKGVIVFRAFGHMREPVQLRGQICAGQGRCGARFSVAVQGPAGDQSVAPEAGEREGDSRGSSEFANSLLPLLSPSRKIRKLNGHYTSSNTRGSRVRRKGRTVAEDATSAWDGLPCWVGGLA